ncbi:hypothetical protein EXIGLDRAFT_736478 [Exidia glandulosa HHB12029]|uniref:Uncharacterized protein n=1 Tax=Exidia glandulosa HHB12029 TaxID=1314781 RepID=A0A165JEV0_EXIGL|nr:hypothetical protein EXIGLDRAFT_736478 [Exidia glandulosa HHB12029]
MLAQELYKAPAHKHAHHLHSIPPREKSTRTLILDHILYLHATARFDARQRDLNDPREDPFAVPYGPGARNSAHRATVVQPKPSSAATRESNARAEGLEKVLCAMLQQPPDSGQLSHSQLPNGVRLRLALGTLINELFADIPAPTQSHHVPTTPSDAGYSTFTSSALPAPIIPLVPISSYNALSATALSSAVASSPLRPSSLLTMPLYELPSPSMSYSSNMGYMHSPSRAAPSSLKVFGRTRHLYLQGSSAGSSSDRRCLRHLIAGCEACVQPSKPVVVSVGCGLMHPLSSVRAFPYLSLKQRRGGSHGRLADLIPLFLRLSALVAMELAREAEAQEARDIDSESSSTGSPDSPRSQISVFDATAQPHEIQSVDNTDTRSRTETSGEAESDFALQAFPTRNWYALAANLFTLAVLEGYLIPGWRGPDGAEVALGIGLGQNPDEGGADASESSVYEPDGMPTLAEATKALFGGLMDDDGTGSSRSGTPTTAEALEYRDEMNARMSEFFGIAPHTPNLASHLDALVSAYPMEPMEHLALHFCKAIARWQGKPELQTYQKTQEVQTPPVVQPAIHDFFVVKDPTQVSRAHKRKRSGGELQLPRKRQFATAEDEEWVGPYGV